MNDGPAKQWVFAAFLAALVLGVQMSAIERPFSGHFSSYQLVMASMARNMLRENFKEPFLPKTDLLVSGKRSLHLNQYPFPSVAAAVGLRLFGGSMEFWGRFQAILSNLLSAILLGFITRRLFDDTIAWTAVAVYALSPYTLIYGQGFFSEPMALFFLLLSLHMILRTNDKQLPLASVLLSALCFSVAVTGRIHLVLFYPVWIFCVFLKHDKQKILRSLLFTFFAAAMPVLWYAHTFFSSIHADNVLTNVFLQVGMRKIGDQNYLASHELYQRIFYIFFQIMVTPLLFPFLLVGLVSVFKRRRAAVGIVIGSLIAGSLVAVISPQKVMAHDFYLYGIFPFICMLTACGIVFVSDRFPLLNRGFIWAILFFFYFIFSFCYFAHPIFKGSPEDWNIREVSRFVQSHTNPEDRIIVAGNNPAPMLYYSDRPAWTLQFNQIGKELAPYLKNPRFRQVDLKKVEEEERAMKNPVAWLEYLMKQGAGFLLVHDRRELEKFPDFLSYLEEHATRISGPTDDFYCFKLSAPARK